MEFCVVETSFRIRYIGKLDNDEEFWIPNSLYKKNKVEEPPPSICLHGERRGNDKWKTYQYHQGLSRQRIEGKWTTLNK